MSTSASCVAASRASFGPAIPTGCRGGFDFTPLFEQSILSLIPSVTFSLVFAAELLLPRRRNESIAAWGRMEALPRSGLLLLPIANAAIWLGVLVFWCISSQLKNRATIPASVFAMVCLALMCAVADRSHRLSRRPSDSVVLYLLLSVGFEAVQVRTLWLMGNVNVAAALLSASAALKLATLTLELACPCFRAQKGPILVREARSSILGRAMFLWVNPLLWKGYLQVLQIGDLGPVGPSLACSSWANRLEGRWKSRATRETRSLISGTVFGQHRLLPALLSSCAWPLLAPIPPKLAILGFTWAQPFLLARATSYQQQQKPVGNLNDAYGLIGATAVIYVGNALATGLYNRQVARSLTIVRGSLVGLIHDKALQSPPSSTQLSSVATLVSTDVDRINAGFQTVHETWAGVVTTAVGLYVLEIHVRWACVAPVIVAAISSVATFFIAKTMPARRRIWVEAIQARVAYMQPMLQNLRTLKFMGLTKAVTDAAQALRVRELEVSKPFRWIVTWNNLSATLPYKLSAAVCFSLFVAAHGDLTAPRAFAALAAIELLTGGLLTTLGTYPSIVSCLANFDRLQAFLVSEEMPQPLEHLPNMTAPTFEPIVDHVIQDSGTVVEESTSLSVVDGSLAFLKEASLGYSSASVPVLTCIDLEIKANEKVLILGRVGGGKSSLLRGLLGQLHTLGGDMRAFRRPLSYCQQSPWLLKGSIRSNITMDDHYSPARYQDVLATCALRDDLSQLDCGDEHRVEDGGTGLSGGQKQRIALARALYAANSVLVLDDVLSSMDAVTEALLMDRLLGQDGFAERHGLTVVMTSHTPRHARFVSRIIVLGPGGTIAEDRAPTDAELSRPDTLLIRVEDQEKAESDLAPSPSEDKSVACTKQPSSKRDKVRFKRLGELSTWRFYMSSMNAQVTAAFLVFAVLGPALSKILYIVLLLWVEAGSGDNGMYLAIFWTVAVLGLLMSAGSVCCVGVFVIPSSSNKLHWTLLTAVMRSPLHYISSMGVGSLVNRFSQDMTLLDNALPTACQTVVLFLVLCISQLVIVAIGANFVGVAIPVILLVVFLIQHFYLRTSQQIRILDLEAKAPLYAHVARLADGLGTIQAFQWAAKFQKQFREALDTSQTPYYLMYCVQGWLALTLDLLIAGIAILLVALATTIKGSSSGAAFGVAMVSLIGLGEAVQALTQSWTTLETSLGSIYRVKAFTEESPAEDGEGVEDPSQPDRWDTLGTVQFEGVSAAHRSGTSLVRCLHAINLNVASGKKIGICGRTGSGKTSMLACITRLVEVEAGRLILGDIDIATLPCETVRARITALTQDAILLPGTVRSNLFALEGCSDERIIAVLEQVRLWESIERNGGLDVDVDKVAFSHGERQLFRIASALLRPNKLLLLDEATSGMDPETEDYVAALLRREWRNTTALIVAHRLSTLLHCDQVIVLDSGLIVERGAPQELLERDSRFRQLWDLQTK